MPRKLILKKPKPMRTRGDEGFSLFELLIVLCIILCLAALLMPTARPALDRLKQVKALAECRRVGDAMLAWTILHGGSPTPSIENDEISTLPYTPIDVRDLRDLLVPEYLSRIPENDPWGNPYFFALDTDDPLGPDVAFCWSGGSDGGFPEARYSIGPVPAAELSSDILWADGEFLHWPE